MEKKKLFSLAIAFAMLGVSFAMVANSAMGQMTTVTDDTTDLTVNAKYPRLYWIGFNESVALPPAVDPASYLGTQQVVGADYLFAFEYNYSFGWDQCEFVIQAWHDGGALGNPYPAAPGDAERNLAFEMYIDHTGAASMVFPIAPEMEVTTAGTASVVLHSAHPTDAAQDVYRVYIPVTFGMQLRAAEVDGNNTFSDSLPVTVGTWDFSVTVVDSGTGASNTSYGEFGIERLVTTTVSGDPVGNAPPGGTTGWMPIQSVITYSSNADYYVTVQIDDLVETSGGADTIPATAVQVQNVHPDNSTGPTDIEFPTTFTGAATPLYVWGTLGVPILASDHGNYSAGPLESDYITDPNPATTPLQWLIDVPGGIEEGVYQTTIYITVDNS